MTPGPTPIPPQVSAAMSKPIIHHRTAEYRKIFAEATRGLKYVFQTEKEVYTFASSGTGAMEAAVANLLSPKDKAVVVQGGKFGQRWAEICRAYGVEVIPIDVNWGEAVQPQKIAEVLEENTGPIKAVFTTLCETSTGVLHPIKRIAEILKASETVLVVDAISALGSCELYTDAWAIDVVVAGSQKGLMLPPGLSFLSISEKAWELVKQAQSPCYYFDLRGAKEALEKQDTPFTPAITLVIGLKEALELIQKKGLENIWADHKKMAEATREAMHAMGLEIFSSVPSEAVTAVTVPQGIDGDNLVRALRERFNIWIAGGQGKLKGKIFRIAHMGYIEEQDIILTISSLEMVLDELGYKVPLGKGVKAAEEVFGKT